MRNAMLKNKYRRTSDGTLRASVAVAVGCECEQHAKREAQPIDAALMRRRARQRQRGEAEAEAEAEAERAQSVFPRSSICTSSLINHLLVHNPVPPR